MTYSNLLPRHFSRRNGGKSRIRKNIVKTRTRKMYFYKTATAITGYKGAVRVVRNKVSNKSSFF